MAEPSMLVAPLTGPSPRVSHPLLWPLRSRAFCLLLVTWMMLDAGFWMANEVLNYTAKASGSTADTKVSASIALGLSLFVNVAELIAARLCVLKLDALLQSLTLETSERRALSRSMSRATLGLWVGIAVEHAIFLSFALRVDSTDGNFGPAGCAYARLSEIGLSVLQLGLPAAAVCVQWATMELLRGRAMAFEDAGSCADVVETHRRNCGWMRLYSDATGMLVQIYSLMTTVIAASLCIAYLSTNLFWPPPMPQLWDYASVAVHLPVLAVMLRAGQRLSRALQQPRVSFERMMLQDVAAVRENWPVAAYLRETAPIYRVFGIPVTGKTARTVIAPSLAALLTVLRLTGDF